jgi:hypothetical protein
MPKQLFDLGKIVTTSRIAARSDVTPGFREFVQLSLTQHSQGDYGNLSEEDKQLNNLSLGTENCTGRIFSQYIFSSPGFSMPIYVITEWDRSATTVMFPSEY